MKCVEKFFDQKIQRMHYDDVNNYGQLITCILTKV